MKKTFKRTLLMIRNQVVTILYLIVLFLIIATSNKIKTITTYNIGSNSSVQAAHLVMKYDPNEVATKVVKPFETFDDIVLAAKDSPVKYNGTMTGYGHDCYGCGNSVACPPFPIITDKITFNDKEYNEVRILAADRKIPCGSIAIVRNSTQGEFIGIVLDRGGAIKNTLMDLLFESEAVSSSFGRQNVEYEIIRWGW